MFLKQNIHKNSFSCEPCEWSCEPFRQIIHTVKASHIKLYNHHVNHVNHFHARAREDKKHLYVYFNQLKPLIDHKINKVKTPLTREKYKKSFTSFTCVVSICFYVILYVNHCTKSFTQSFTSFTWI